MRMAREGEGGRRRGEGQRASPFPLLLRRSLFFVFLVKKAPLWKRNARAAVRRKRDERDSRLPHHPGGLRWPRRWQCANPTACPKKRDTIYRWNPKLRKISGCTMMPLRVRGEPTWGWVICRFFGKELQGPEARVRHECLTHADS